MTRRMVDTLGLARTLPAPAATDATAVISYRRFNTHSSMKSHSSGKSPITSPGRSGSIHFIQSSSNTSLSSKGTSCWSSMHWASHQDR